MGIFRQEIVVVNPNSQNSVELSALVDTGSTYTWIPEDTLRDLGVQPTFKRSLKLATGQVIERDATQIIVVLNGEGIFTICIFGDPGSEPLLGALTLESFSLGVDPINKKLIPTVSYLA
jgi:clan AA aspartic protease